MDRLGQGIVPNSQPPNAEKETAFIKINIAILEITKLLLFIYAVIQ